MDSWLAKEIEKGASATGAVNVGVYAGGIESALEQSNINNWDAITRKDGFINQNPNLDGFIAEHHHANTFNIDAATKGTRLLDFSYSPYMATYFATVDTNEECSVWAINKKLLNLNYQKQIKTNLKEWFPDKLFFDSDIPSNLDTINKEIGSNDLNISSHFLLDAESSRPSIRVVRQQGVFIVPISLRELNEAIKTITFKDCLWQSFGKDSEAEFEQVDIDSLLDNKSYESDVACLKINLPVEVHRSTLRQLKLMGIDGESLFPGLGGLAMSQLQQHIR